METRVQLWSLSQKDFAENTVFQESQQQIYSILSIIQFNSNSRNDSNS